MKKWMANGGIIVKILKEKGGVLIICILKKNMKKKIRKFMIQK